MKALLAVAVVVMGCGPVSSTPIPGNACDRATDVDVCAVDGKLAGCRDGCGSGDAPPCSGVWVLQPCAACRAGQPLTNCNPASGTCSCD